VNLDRVRERLRAAEDRTVYKTPIIIYEFAGDTPPHHANDMVRRTGESDEQVLRRYGISYTRGQPPPLIRLGLTYPASK
jgi:hypothetical protein